ncbi:hypothetical protein FRC0190_01314 [Corynebacterium rouxii]|uniref:Uncharacterized protein n=1 Tax=Corynebacterium rouxii TaxID=2719119 RepID=A0A6I8MG56_9CORY|nr:hypothetical protein FRC0190_01314 [Corynebacterium rouxii]
MPRLRQSAAWFRRGALLGIGVSLDPILLERYYLFSSIGLCALCAQFLRLIFRHYSIRAAPLLDLGRLGLAELSRWVPPNWCLFLAHMANYCSCV